MNISLAKIASVLNASCHRDGDAVCRGVSLDSRTILAGELFIALKGERVDGHQFIDAVKQKGASAVIVQHAISTDIPHIIVEDTKLALQQFAEWYRQQFDLPVIALTGSYGKTTTKEMIASILQECGSTLFSQGNLNSEYGAPLSVLRLNADHQYAVFELGANFVGEIAKTVQIVKPKVAMITIADAVHLEGFGGTIKHVAQAKAEIFQGLDAEGIAVLNADDLHYDFWQSLEILKNKKIVSFASESPADIRGKIISSDAHCCFTCQIKTPVGEFEVHLPVPGEHQLKNALAAIAAVYGLGICDLDKMQRGLSRVTPVKRRLNFKTGLHGCHVIDDSYNASPAAVKAAIKVLMQHSGKHIAVLADMRELGELAEFYHREIGRFVKDQGVETLFTYGQLSAFISEEFGKGAQHFSSQEELIPLLQHLLDAETTVLVKGSLSMEMDRVVNAIV